MLLDLLSYASRQLIVLDVVKVHVMQENVWRQAFEDPFMTQGLLSSDTFLGVPSHASFEQVQEQFIIALEYP